MFIPIKRDGKLYPVGKANAYGRTSYSRVGQPFGYAYVHDRESLDKSAVRADSSASKSRAEHIGYDVRVLIERRVTPKNGDMIELGQRKLRIVRIQERTGMSGRVNHWEVDCVAV